MINLLPEEKKRELRHEYRLRRGIVVIFMVAVISVFAAATLLPLSVVLEVHHEAAVGAAASLIAKEEKEQAAVRGMVREIAERVRILSVSSDDVMIVADLIPAILSKKGNVSIKGFSQQRSEDQVLIRLNGVAPRRDDFTSFLRALETSGLFSAVRSPVSNLVKDRDLVFSIELILR